MPLAFVITTNFVLFSFRHIPKVISREQSGQIVLHGLHVFVFSKQMDHQLIDK